MICTFRAAGRQRLQLGGRMSAVLERELGTRLGASFVGARAADWAAQKSRLSMAFQASADSFGIRCLGFKCSWWHQRQANYAVASERSIFSENHNYKSFSVSQ